MCSNIGLRFSHTKKEIDSYKQHMKRKNTKKGKQNVKNPTRNWIPLYLFGCGLGGGRFRLLEVGVGCSLGGEGRVRGALSEQVRTGDTCDENVGTLEPTMVVDIKVLVGGEGVCKGTDNAN